MNLESICSNGQLDLAPKPGRRLNLISKFEHVALLATHFRHKGSPASFDIDMTSRTGTEPATVAVNA